MLATFRFHWNFKLFQVLIASQIYWTHVWLSSKAYSLGRVQNTCTQSNDRSVNKASSSTNYAVILCPYSETIHLIAAKLRTMTFPLYLLCPEHSLHRYLAAYLCIRRDTVEPLTFQPGTTFVFRYAVTMFSLSHRKLPRHQSSVVFLLLLCLRWRVVRLCCNCRFVSFICCSISAVLFCILHLGYCTSSSLHVLCDLTNMSCIGVQVTLRFTDEPLL